MNSNNYDMEDIPYTYGHIDHVSFGRREKRFYNYRDHYTSWHIMNYILKNLLKTSIGKPYNEVRSHFIKKYCHSKSLGWAYKKYFDDSFGHSGIKTGYYVNNEGVICSDI